MNHQIDELKDNMVVSKLRYIYNKIKKRYDTLENLIKTLEDKNKNDFQEQIEDGKRLVSSKIHDGKYIAYFQAYTNTYGPIEKLKTLYEEAIHHPDIVALSIATRPDCLQEEVLNLLEKDKPNFPTDL